MDKSTTENGLASMVSHVFETRLNFGAIGIFKNHQDGTRDIEVSLPPAKPIGIPFANDFDKTMDCLGNIQVDIALTLGLHNLILVDSREKKLRFTWNVFEKRKRTQEGRVLSLETLPPIQIITFTRQGDY